MDKKILELKYENLLKIFKPTFGNIEHIRIFDMTKDIAKKEASLQRTVERGKDGRKMIDKIKSLKERAIYLLEQDRQHLIK